MLGRKLSVWPGLGSHTDIENDPRFRVTLGSRGRGYPIVKAAYVAAGTELVVELLLVFGSFVPFVLPHGVARQVPTATFRFFFLFPRLRRDDLWKLMFTYVVIHIGMASLLIYGLRKEKRFLLLPFVVMLLFEMFLTSYTMGNLFITPRMKFWYDGQRYIMPTSVALVDFCMKIGFIKIVLRCYQYFTLKQARDKENSVYIIPFRELTVD